MKKEELREKEKEYIRRYFKENLKLDIEDIRKSGLMTKEEFERFEDRQFDMRFKTCSCCGMIKPKRDFYNSNVAKDKTYSCCKKCQNRKCLPARRKHGKKLREKHREEFGGYYVYLIFNKSKELMYVGETTNIYTRMVSHFYKRVDTTKELFENDDVGLIKYIELNSKKETEVLEIAFINNKLRNDKEPYISSCILEDDYLIDYPRLNKNRGSGQVDRKLLVELCRKMNNKEYTWKTWREIKSNKED